MFSFLRKLRQRFLKENRFTRYLIYALGEMVLVVLGILIAVQIRDRNTNIKNRNTEKVYLQEMLEDFEANRLKSKETIGWIDEMVPALIVLMEQSEMEKPDISVDSLNYNFSYITDMPTFNSTDRVFDNLIGSGDFKLIRSMELKNILAEYYKAIDLIDIVQSTHELELVTSFQPYILNYLDYQAVNYSYNEDWEVPVSKEQNKILDVVHDTKFRNIIMLKLTILSDLLGQNEGIEEMVNETIDILKEELGKDGD